MAFDTMNHFLHYMQMFLVGASYWNMVYGKEIGEVQKDEEGMENMRVLGENMAWLLKKYSWLKFEKNAALCTGSESRVFIANYINNLTMLVTNVINKLGSSFP